MAINRKENFGVEGFRIQRNNPDGTIPTYDRMLGFAGTIDVSALAGTETISLKQDNGTVVTETINITGGTYADSSAATPEEVKDELVTQIAAGSLNLTATVDTDTSRLMLALTSGTATKVQLYGTLISYLGFGRPDGESAVTTDIGLKIVKAFDSTKSITLPKSIKDKEEIENETGDGSLTSVVVPANVKGIAPVITCAKNDYELKQMVSGGVYDSTADTYEPPTIEDQAIVPSFNIEIFTPSYDQGSNLKTNIAGWEKITLRNCSGYEGDISKEAKTWSDIVFNLDATEYTNASGTRQAAWTEEMLTLAEYATLDVENV